MYEVTLRFKTDDRALIDNLVIAWTESEGINIRTAGGSDEVDLTYVKEREV